MPMTLVATPTLYQLPTLVCHSCDDTHAVRAVCYVAVGDDGSAVGLVATIVHDTSSDVYVVEAQVVDKGSKENKGSYTCILMSLPVVVDRIPSQNVHGLPNTISDRENESQP